MSVVDADGHFLLIEAAPALPPWVTPECSDHRVWIRNGRCHVITLSHHPGACLLATDVWEEEEEEEEEEGREEEGVGAGACS